jgi:hypothetical protein
LRHKRVRYALDTLVGVAGLWARLGQSERAVELAAFVLHHRASPQHTKDKAERLLTELGSQLSAEALAGAEKRVLDSLLPEVVEAVLAEL